MSGRTISVPLAKVAAGKITRVVDGRDEVALYNIDGQIFATSDRCTHGDVSLWAEGSLDGDVVECGAHFGAFNVRTGKAVARPCIEPLRLYRVSVMGDQVVVELDL